MKRSVITESVLRRLEMLTAIVASIAIIGLLIFRAGHAGALWRDECALVQLSQMPKIGDVFRNFPHEAFPPLFPLLVRVWAGIFGSTDNAFRWFGASVGMVFVAVAWVSARLLGTRVPLLALGLIGLNSAFLTFGSSMRGYGLAAALIALAFAVTGRLLVKPTPILIGVTAIVFVASVQLLLHNTILLFVIATSAIVVCLLRRQNRRAFVVLALGVLAFLSFLPYFGPYWRAREWDMTVRLSVPIAWLWRQFAAAFGEPSPVMAWVWCVISILLIAQTLRYLRSAPIDRSANDRDILLFAAVSLIASLAAYGLFLRFLRYYPQPWYFLGLLAITGLALDLFAGAIYQGKAVRIARLAFTIILIVAVPLGSTRVLAQRQTNIDILADELQKTASSSDLILVSPWQYGIPFSWYYHGTTPWITLPQLAEHGMHRYDLVKTRMISPDPIGDVRNAVGQALRDGHRVWIVGEIRVPSDGTPAKTLSPAPDPEYGWDSIVYVESWMEQMGMFLRSHVREAHVVTMAGPNVINDEENAPLVVARGWKD